MRRAAMSLAAAFCGFMVLLLTVTVVHCDNVWDVNCRPTSICAVIGSTVIINCAYSFPPQINNKETTVTERLFFRKQSQEVVADLRSDPEYSLRVEFECTHNNCLLRIKDLRESDSTTYRFRFTTNHEGGKNSGPPVTLSVTGLQVQVRSSTGGSSTAELTCHSRCPLPESLSYSWMKDQKMVTGQTQKTFSPHWGPLTSVSCGLTGEKYRSPSVSVKSFWEVNYATTEICALKGFAVEISCSYRYPTTINNQKTSVSQAFWFRGIEQNGGFIDLKQDQQYSGRVTYGGGENNCALTISDVRESDAALYKFRFVTNQQGGTFTGTPGVTLSVKVPRLQIHVRKSLPHPDYRKWTELTCQSNCQLSGRPSYIWYKNEQPILEGEQNYILLQTVNSADRYQCALKQRDRFRSPSVYAPYPPSVSVSPLGEIVEGNTVTLTCSSYANPAASYSWYKEQQFIQDGKRLIFQSIKPSDSGQYFCEAGNELWWTQSQGKSIDVKYPPRPPSVSVSPPGEIVEGNMVTLTCSSDANPAASYIWYKEQQFIKFGMQLIFQSIKPSDSGQYFCKAGNELKLWNKSNETSIDVKYPPRPPSVSVSPPGEIMEGNSVTLTCSSDANPAASYSWNKGNETVSKGQSQLHFTSISSKDRGNYSCRAENGHGRISSALPYLDVQYAPKLPSVSVSPPGEIEEGGSVNLTCSSDANPAANVTWYKEGEFTPKASGQTLTIITFRDEHRGDYYCEARNRWGRQKSNSTVHLIIVPGKQNLALIGIFLAGFLLIAPLCAFLLIRKWKKSKSPSQLGEEQHNPERSAQSEQQEELNYASIHFVRKQTDPIYSNVTAAGTSTQVQKDNADVEYATVQFRQGSSSPRELNQEPFEDPSTSGVPNTSIAIYQSIVKGV